MSGFYNKNLPVFTFSAFVPIQRQFLMPVYEFYHYYTQPNILVNYLCTLTSFHKKKSLNFYSHYFGINQK